MYMDIINYVSAGGYYISISLFAHIDEASIEQLKHIHVYIKQ